MKETDDIEFLAPFGYEYKKVRISKPHGCGGALYHIYIDNFYHGMLIKLKNDWLASVNDLSSITGDDILILREIIQAAAM